MARVCTICTHSERAAINAALVATEALRTIAVQWSVSKSALIRHKSEHLPVSLIKAERAREVTESGGLLAQIVALQERTMSILLRAEQAGDLRTALIGIREARANVELLVEMERGMKTETGGQAPAFVVQVIQGTVG